MIQGGRSIRKRIDWRILICYVLLVAFGMLNIYSSSIGDAVGGWSWDSKYGMQFIWLGVALLVDVLLLFAIPIRFYNVFLWWIYFLMIGTLVLTLFAGTTVSGSRSWLVMGPLRVQPAEFSKIAVSLALAALMEKFNFSFGNRRDVLRIALVLLVPMGLILLENEAGLSLIYLGFLLVLYREGMSPWVLIFLALAVLLVILSLVISPFAAILIFSGLLLGWMTFTQRNFRFLAIGLPVIAALAFLPALARIDLLEPVLGALPPALWLTLLSAPPALFVIIRSLIRKKRGAWFQTLTAFLAGVVLILSTDTFVNKILQEHQRQRIESLLGIRDDPMGVGYNVHQSMIAIGSGGFSGKGYLHGTQTRFDFVPEQSTDFIFCTVGEEWGFLGALGVLVCYLLLILFLINSAEKQSNRFARIYGYCVAACIAMHVVINIGMTIGLMPVIGIPLPLVSYGGSSLLAFSILIFIYLRMIYEQRGR